MDPKSCYRFTFLLLISLFLQSTVVSGKSSVFFIDNPSHRYFRSPSSKDDQTGEVRNNVMPIWACGVVVIGVEKEVNYFLIERQTLGVFFPSVLALVNRVTWYLPAADGKWQISSLSLSEVGATVSVLLGFAPPATLSGASSSKLNEVLIPNPFDRPGSVLILEVTGAEGVSIEALRSDVMNKNRADIQLPDANEVSLFSLDEPKTDAEYSDKELSDFASWFSGSYVNGELTIPLENAADLKFQLSKEADREFVTSLVSLTHKIQRAMEMHHDLSGAVRRPSELISGKFDGLKEVTGSSLGNYLWQKCMALKEHYGAEGVAKGTKLFSIVMSKMFDSLTEAYKGQIVGVIVCNERPSVAESLFNVIFTSQPSARWLEETKDSSNSTAIEEIVLVRRTVAWITGILLIIATLLGPLDLSGAIMKFGEGSDLFSISGENSALVLSFEKLETRLLIIIAPISTSPEREEESRWLREEARWLREEQRWLREERRWEKQREALLVEIQKLQLRVKELESRNSVVVEGSSVSETVSAIAKLLQEVTGSSLGNSLWQKCKLLKEGEAGKNVTVIAESGSIALPLVLEAAKQNEVVVKEAPQQEKVIREAPKEAEGDGNKAKKRRTLKKGSEGDEVRLMQEQLLKLGFYCGEEDMEFSSFAGGTERAVKTWQASSDVREDGIMTSELLEKLYTVQKIDTVKENPKQPDGTEAKASANGAPIASIMEIEEVQQTIVKEDGVSETEVSHHRVFLLGENRWEEPSRLSTSKKPAETTNGSSTTVKCLTCRGEGRLLCMECDGTGEPNIEEQPMVFRKQPHYPAKVEVRFVFISSMPDLMCGIILGMLLLLEKLILEPALQFMEWIDEGMKCPYCEGHGFVTCDVCDGKKMVKA
ncbi:putative non-lysosomal glucosylceramidase-like isoform X1 [Capsicum annuum]|nr:putative non-lysosomal glucosylceramidase-like isoform X1 [Capsicum annuum]